MNHANWAGLCEAITITSDDQDDNLMSDDVYSTLRIEWNTYSTETRGKKLKNIIT